MGADVSSFGDAEQAILCKALGQAFGCQPPSCLLTLRLSAGSVTVDAVMTIPDELDPALPDASLGGSGAGGGSSSAAGAASSGSAVAAAIAATASQVMAQPASEISSSLGVTITSVAPIAVASGVTVALVVAPPPPWTPRPPSPPMARSPIAPTASGGASLASQSGHRSRVLDTHSCACHTGARLRRGTRVLRLPLAVQSLAAVDCS